MKKNQLNSVLAIAGVATAVAAFATGAAIRIDQTKLNQGVPSANPRAGSPENVLPLGFSLTLLAQGSDPLENPSGVITQFGYLNDFLPGDTNKVEATKTEPDENTYLILDHNPGGPTPGYDYGRRFLIQGHEASGGFAYITRINLDITDPAHRITLLTPVGASGNTGFTRIDGSVWNPHTGTLLFTQENGAAGGVIELGVEWGSVAHSLDGIFGKGDYEGIRPDDRGNILVIEDAGGTGVNIDPTDPASPKVAKDPNSFVYRFVPNDRTNLSAGGKLQALQVWIGGQSLQFIPVNTNHPFGDVFSDNQLKLHTMGSAWPVRWVTIHDTAIDGTDPFNANAAAKTAGATPFKRPENAQFLPGSAFNTFFFCPTGDTDSRSGNTPALAARGAWGSIFRVDLSPDTEWGTISIFILGDKDHSSFDNLTFSDTRILLATEDRGDLLHRQLNALDSIWAFDVTQFGGTPARLVALGRDPASTLDVSFLEAVPPTPNFQNEGDNEPTGLIVSDGGASLADLIGKPLNPVRARVFFTQQHGLNRVFEISGR